MRHLFFFLFVFGLSQFSSAQTPKFATPVAYNDYIVDQQYKISATVNQLIESLDSGNLAYSTTKLDAMKKASDEAIARIKGLPAFKGNTSFRDAAAELFVFYKTCAENEFKELVVLLLGSSKPDNYMDRIAALQKQVDEKEKKLDDVYISEQKKFARDNNFTIADN